MAAMTSFRAEKCCRLVNHVSAHAAFPVVYVTHPNDLII